MFFEVYKQGNLIIRGKQILNTISLENELMLAPSTTLVLPIDWLKVIDGREEIKIYLDECRVFWGIVWDIEVDKQNETIELDVRHVITEWQYRQISVNHAISNKELNIVYKGDKVEVSDENDESITANGFTVSVAVGSKMTDAQIIERARASAWRTSNGDKVEITSVKVQQCSDASAGSADLGAWGSAMATQFEWSKNQKYWWVNPPTIANSRTRGTCVAFPSVSLVRAGYLKDGQWLYLNQDTHRLTGNAKEYILSHPELFQVSYPNRTIDQLGSNIHAGDIVAYLGGSGHIMVYMGKNSSGQPIFNTMGSTRGLGITYSHYANKKINMLVRLLGSSEPSEHTEKICTDATLNAEGTYTITFATAKGTKVSAEVNLTATEEPKYEVVDDPAVVDKLQDIYNDKNFAYPGWSIDFQDGAEERMIDYVYSRQNKLEALTQTMELTDDLWWRVGLWNDKRVEIGKFGEIQPYTLSTKPSGKTNIHIISEPTIDYDFENVVNVATVYSDKSDGGMSSLTLREVYNDPSLQDPKFPVVILHANVNNERDYTKYITRYQPKKLAPNNEIEFAVLDEESIALESGTVIEGTYAFNDLSPFQIEDKDNGVVTDEKRIEAAKTVYHRIIKKLIQARRSYDIHVVTEPIPCDLEVGDKIRFLYDNKIWNLDACSSYWKKILSMDDMFYVTAISYNYDEYGNLTNELTLTKWLKIERDSSNQ